MRRVLIHLNRELTQLTARLVRLRGLAAQHGTVLLRTRTHEQPE